MIFLTKFSNFRKAIVETMESQTPADTVLQEQMKQDAEKEKELLEQVKYIKKLHLDD